MSTLRALVAKARRSRSPSPRVTTSDSNSLQSGGQVKVFPTGLKVLHQPESAVVDIIFVHGLTGDRERTWTAKDASSPWPQTLLPAALPQARILAFGYDANVVDWRTMVSKNRIGNHSRNLLTAVATHRENDDTNARPILFVAHSLGGLVCEDALLASRNSADAHLQNILTCTRGIIFLGTPHSGSGFARWAEFLAKTIGLIKQTNPAILEVLTTESEVLARIQSDFHTMSRARAMRGEPPIEITCFYEELAVHGVGEVVPMHSAILPGYINIGIHSNHMNMTKFETEDDPGFISVTGELRRWIKKLDQMPVTQSRTSKAAFLVPFDKDDKFVGREDILSKIDERLKNKRRVAIAGIGGVGKSQIAIEYCYRFRKSHPNSNVFWVHASNAERFDQAYKEIARKLALPGWDDPKIDTFQLVFEWLSDDDHGPWLLVLDNADDSETFFGVGSPKPLANYLPRSSKGTLIVTTRDSRVGERLADREKSIPVLPLVVQEAQSLLWSRLSVDEAPPGTETYELLDTLEYLPLAITQAAAFISENRISLAKYIQMLRADDSDLTALLDIELQDQRRDHDAPNSVLRTWKLSFDHIQKQNPQAAQLLSLMAMLDRHEIPETLLRKENQRQVEVTTSLGTLQAFSLVRAEKGGDTFVMHRLVQLSIRYWLELRGIEAIFQEEAVQLLSVKFPLGDYTSWKLCEALLPHAQVVLGYCMTSESGLLDRATLLYKVASFKNGQGRYDVARRCSEEALDIRQRLLTETSLITLESSELLARVLRCQGKYDAAEEMSRRVLEGREKVLGPEHPDTLSSVNDLGLVLKEQCDYKAAEEMNRRALNGFETALGPEHPETLTLVNNLALVLESQGRYEAAEEMNRRALEGYEKVLGPEHPETLLSVSNLGGVLKYQGKYEASEQMQRRALEGYEKVLGPEHPHSLRTVSNLAMTLRDQGKFEAAEEMNRRAVEGYERLLGPDHPDTLKNISNLALVVQDRGKYEVAEKMNLRVLEWKEKVLGPEHPSTLVSINNLAMALKDQSKYEAAEEMSHRALEGSEKLLGPEHPVTLVSINNLAMVLKDQNKYEAAEEMSRRAVEGYEKVLGLDHPDTLEVISNLALVLHIQGKHEAAEEMNRRALEGYERALGPEHPSTLTSVSRLAISLQRVHRYEEALKLHDRAQAGLKKVLGSDHPTTMACSQYYSEMLQEMESKRPESH